MNDVEESFFNDLSLRMFQFNSNIMKIKPFTKTLYGTPYKVRIVAHTLQDARNELAKQYASEDYTFVGEVMRSDIERWEIASKEISSNDIR